MKTININLYSFQELSKEVQAKIIEKHYQNEDYPFLGEDLKESCKFYLDKNKVKYQNLELFYSLSYSQGDGLCYTGTFTKDGITMQITNNSRYCYAKSVNFEFTDESRETLIEIDNAIDPAYACTKKQDKAIKQLKAIYFDICKQLEKEGYAILSYRMDIAEFTDFCESNGYTFEENGTMRTI